jgi:protein-tyrosine phosphatase
MDWIDENVAVGNRWDAFWRRLKKEGVEVVVDTRPFFDQRFGKYDRKPNIPKVLRAADLVVALSQQGAKVLVRCNEGKDRSAFVAMVYVAKRYGLSYREAYDKVKAKRLITVHHWDWVGMLPELDGRLGDREAVKNA